MKKFILTLLLIFSVLLFPKISQTLFADEILTNEISENQSNFCIINEKNYYYLNNESNQIEHFINNATKVVELNLSTTIEKFCVLKNGELAVLDNMKHLHFFNKDDYSLTNSISTILYLDGSKSSTYRVENVSSIISDIYSNVYLLDYENGFILKANAESINFEVVATISASQNSKLTVLNSTNEIVVLNETTLLQNNSSLTLSTNPKAIFSDAKNFVYIVYENYIEQYKNLTLSQTFQNITFGKDYSIDLENGIIYYVLNNQIEILSNVASNQLNFTPPVNPAEKTALSNKVSICSVLANTSLLSNPYSSTEIAQLTPSDSVILLANCEDFGTSFCYVLLSKNNESQVGYVQKKFLEEQSFEQTQINQIPIRKDINAYKYPIQNSTYFLSTLEFNQQYLEIEQITINNTTFSVLKIDDNFIYVNSNDLIEADKNYISTFLNTNATLSPYNNQSIIIYNNEEKSTELISINKKVNVKLINKNSYSQMSEIELLHENQIIHGFVETKFILPQNDFSIPLAIILSLICLITIVLIIIKLKKDKTKTQINAN